MRQLLIGFFFISMQIPDCSNDSEQISHLSSEALFMHAPIENILLMNIKPI